ncbi:hypothetical protein Acor_71020 [Acrocarpospora corrugata]|uniref:M23ase beta-sheet core domain-containing protein n=1 Tax=Acrocarpospora corrugata TaxID=35763 RepID=A0A5M3W863_9ACTN|nr:M23 family metallopeptidase [Acrocarpospora corrugata]GES05034.1 hypothetical protein Acor_71020 [Acrocarpospora corrugata]
MPTWILATLLALHVLHAPEPRWNWPLPNPQLLQRFDPPSHRWLPGHRGVDLQAHPGQPVLAAGPGTVTFAGKVGGLTAIAITHPGGLRTTYLPVEPTVHPGQPITTGTQIGTITDHPVPHCPSTCLHWGLLRTDRYLDPLLLLGLGKVRLLPLNLTQRQVLP